MKFAVEAWAPEYGAPSDDDTMTDSDVEVVIDVEVAEREWAPRAPAPGTTGPQSFLFVDGVRRVEANVWVTAGDGRTHQGICASYAAGAVRCDGSAALVAAQVRRGLFTALPGAEPITTRHGTFALHGAATDDPIALALLLQRRMGELEGEVAAAAGGAEVVMVDGPLKLGQHDVGLVGYVKTHRRSYGDQRVRDVVSRLAVGERTPLLLIDAQRPRLSWYLRLPCAVHHGWAGVVRLETTADQPVADAVTLADGLAAGLPRFASVPQKDPRAPQNLVPIGGLERELRRRLGDPHLLLRALRAAAA